MALGYTPYEIWLVETTGAKREYPLVQFIGEIGQDDATAIATAKQRLQDLIDAIDENPSLIEVRTDVVMPAALIRMGRLQQELSE